MAYSPWILKQWRQVIFSDESQFKLFNDSSAFVRRQPGEEMLPQCLQPTMKHGGGGLMAWGCISYQGVGRLLRVHGIINASYYQKVLKFCLLPSAGHLYSDQKYIFMHDNAPIHTAKLCKEFLEAKGFEVLPWPGQSPDLNPIDNL